MAIQLIKVKAWRDGADTVCLAFYKEDGVTKTVKRRFKHDEKDDREKWLTDLGNGKFS
jgi:hypothetical protein